MIIFNVLNVTVFVSQRCWYSVGIDCSWQSVLEVSSFGTASCLTLSDSVLSRMKGMTNQI